jgi:amino acid transporter
MTPCNMKYFLLVLLIPEPLLIYFYLLELFSRVLGKTSEATSIFLLIISFVFVFVLNLIIVLRRKSDRLNSLIFISLLIAAPMTLLVLYLLFIDFLFIHTPQKFGLIMLIYPILLLAITITVLRIVIRKILRNRRQILHG